MRLATLLGGLVLATTAAALAAPPAKKPPVPPAAANPTPNSKAPTCDLCEYTCLFAEQIVMSERKAFLFENLGPVVKSALALDNQVVDLSKKWAQRDDATTPNVACYRMIASSKTDKELQAVLDSTDPISAIGMETDWSTHDCKITTKGLESKICAPLYKSLLAHEKSHQKSCKDAWGKVGAKATNVQTNPKLRAMEEARAYRDGANHMEREMKRLAKKTGCGLKTSGRATLAPPPTDKEVETAKKDIAEIPSFMRSGK